MGGPSMTARRIFLKGVFTLSVPVLLLVLFSSFAYGDWISIDPPPLASGNWNLWGVHFPIATEGWAVGWDLENREAVLLRYSAGNWSSIDLSPPPAAGYTWLLTGVQFTSTNEGWAVGQKGNPGSATQGVLAHYLNGSWSYANNPYVSEDWWLLRLHFTSSADGWAVGWNRDVDTDTVIGLVLRHNVAAGVPPWTKETLPSYVTKGPWGLNAVHFTSKDEGWAVGKDYQVPLSSGLNIRKGVLLHYLNGIWSFYTPPDVSDDWELSGVYFSSPYDGWAVGTDYENGTGVLLHYTHDLVEKWESISPPPQSGGLLGVNFTSIHDGWAVGGPTILHYSNGEWNLVDPPNVSASWGLRDVFFTSAGNGWAVGDNNTAHRGAVLRSYNPSYVSLSPGCGGKSPCYDIVQDAIDSSESFTGIYVTEDTFLETIGLSSPKVLLVRGGWDSTFSNLSSNNSIIEGSLTIGSGKLIVEYVTLR